MQRWVPPQNVDNIFKSVRDQFFAELFNHDMPKRIVAHFSQRLEHCRIADSLVMKLRDILESHIPGLSTSSWSIREDQPLCLEPLQCVSSFMHDPDSALFSSLLEGVSTGFDGGIPPSNIFHTKEINDDSSSSDRPNLSVHLENWKSAEDRPDLVELLQEELERMDFSLRRGCGIGSCGLSTWSCYWELGLTITDGRPPRLVVDSTVCGANGNCIVNEHQCMPSAKDVLRAFPLGNNQHELSALGLDVKAAHKRVVIKESHPGLLGYSHRNALYFYKVAPFGAIFSAHWWGRLGSFGYVSCIRRFLWPMHFSCLWMISCYSSGKMCFHLQLHLSAAWCRFLVYPLNGGKQIYIVPLTGLVGVSISVLV